MPKYVIERSVPGASKLTQDQLRKLSQKSRAVLRTLGPDIIWLQSYVTDDKLFCVYVASNESSIWEHARLGGFPCDRVYEVRGIIDAATAEDDARSAQEIA